ncbi:OpgC family protein [Lichenifustis flavocetrariae]|uniref:OpgC domain-containing protein n=1 Tax=Lichenifustis flavocetrariae TaxID=2949735 RepID=A0AA41YZV4_9HYPH|nr:OpgC domain-containing protein [Lichenifustis flavocetrariae]MCW6510290.1 OpgC domain-containing protein [Lichenifustis flavocetrariae]
MSSWRNTDPDRHVSRRDPRVDLLRGLALIMIFFDHIPYNSLSNLTLRCFGFSDAAEVFVFLAGYSGFLVYSRVFEQRGVGAGLRKIAMRCVSIWGAHAMLLLTTAVVLILRYLCNGRPPTELNPLIQDGLAGIIRGLSLQAQPAYLDILPLYIVFVLTLPLIIFGLQRSLWATLAVSLAVYGTAILTHRNLPNQIDARAAAAAWSFNPFTWQVVYVAGAAAGLGIRRRTSWIITPPPAARLLCGAYLVYAFIAADGWNQWPSLAEAMFPRSALDTDWKVLAPPWRVLHGLAFLYLILTSSRFAAAASWPALNSLTACGRHSLTIFSAGCLLALIGRIAFQDLGRQPVVQIAVNLTGLAGHLGLAIWLDRNRKVTARPSDFAMAHASQGI